MHDACTRGERMAVILYVDRDQLYMSTVKLLLEEHGFRVLLARSREHMRQVLLASVVDLALVDSDFAQECPQLLADIHGLSPLTRTMLLGMRTGETITGLADAYCARLDGPARLIAALQAVIGNAAQGSARPA